MMKKLWKYLLAFLVLPLSLVGCSYTGIQPESNSDFTNGATYDAKLHNEDQSVITNASAVIESKDYQKNS